jgi:hypothetical protein
MTLDDSAYCVIALLAWARNVDSEEMRLGLLDRVERVAQELGVDLAQAADFVERIWGDPAPGRSAVSGSPQ